jgi:hypothetical protein
VAAAAERGEHRPCIVVVVRFAERAPVEIDDRVRANCQIGRGGRVLDLAARVNERRLDRRAVLNGRFDIRCRDEVDFKTE